VGTRRRPPAPTDAPTLLGYAADQGRTGAPAPLAERMRAQTLDEIVGQAHLLGSTGPLRRAIESDQVPSMILWGDPGCGKTTLAHVISRATRATFEAFSAVLGGVAELREIVARAQLRRRQDGQGTLLFVDEIHRFNRAQQDAFLPHVENGTVTLIGATTENPSFAVNAAVLSRARVFRLKPLDEKDVEKLLRRAYADPVRGLKLPELSVHDDVWPELARRARGDGRRALNQLEALAKYAVQDNPEQPVLGLELMLRFDEAPALLYDKSGEEHYNVTSAFIKSMRGSDPDASVYWLMRMLEAGDDPLFILRRMVIFASEDVGNADPRALQVACNADDAFRRLGMPEGTYPIAQACLYLACCPKSNSVGSAFKAAQQAVTQYGALPVPNKLRNAPTQLMKNEGYGQAYQYAHDHPDHFVPGETYLPERISSARYYTPSNQGLELSIAQRLARLRGEGDGA
jgi:putative ATPase